MGASTIKCNECIFKIKNFQNSTENLTYRIKGHKIDYLENKIPLSFYFIVFFPKLWASTIKCNKYIFKNQKFSNSTENLTYWIKRHKIDYLENKNPLSFYFIVFFPKLDASTIKCNKCIFKNQKFLNSTENLTYGIKRYK